MVANTCGVYHNAKLNGSELLEARFVLLKDGVEELEETASNAA